MKAAARKTLISLALLLLSRLAWGGVVEGIDALASNDYAKAIAEFRPLAINGDARAQWWLGNAYEEGETEEDLRQAAYWYRKAAEQGHRLGQYSLGALYRAGRGVPRDARQASVWIRRAAEQGYALAQYALGSMFEDGEGLPKDQRQAVVWYLKAAEQGNAEAQLSLGIAYDVGRGAPKDDQQAVNWYRKAAEQGNATAQFNLGVKYDNGRGVSKDSKEAATWFRKAADQGDAQAQNNLGAMYSTGNGVPKDEWAAVAWYRRAAEQGEVNAQFSLGSMYSYGRGVDKDDQQALVWFRKAAEQDYPDAWVALGVMHDNGRGVLKDERQAVTWFRKAAEQGSAGGQFNLGVMYDAGRGVPKDTQLAYFWWLLAAASGNDNARKNRDIVEPDLTATQRSEAQASARDWKPKVAASSKRSLDNPKFGTGTPSERGDSPDSGGSGFYVASARVVTNNHVTQGCNRLRVAGQFEGQLLNSDPRNDLALVALQGGPADVATIRAGRVKVGESAMVAGFPLSGLLSGFNVTTGNVSSLAGIGGDTRLVQITAPVQPGNSGGPLLDAGGKVMGVVVSKLNALKVAQSTGDVPQNVNFAINASVLMSFLDANGVEYKSGSTGPSIATPEVARKAQAITVLIECWK
jgi:uncharacterized protein